MNRRAFLMAGLAAGATLSLGLAERAWADDAYPSHPIRLVLSLAPGSSVDTLARSFSNELGTLLKQPVVVENRPGGDSVIATKLVLNAPADGYTLLLAIPAHAINVSQYPSLPYDPVKNFTPIALVASNMNVLVVPPDSPVHTLQDLIDLAKKKPGQLNYGNVGGTSGGASDLLNYMAGLKTVNVLYKGAGAALTDLMSSRLDFMFTALSSGIPFIKSGKLRAIAVTGAKRHPSLPDVPPVADTVPGYEVLGWYALLGPAGLPQPIVHTLNSTLFEALKLPEVRARMASVGSDPAEPNTPEDLAKFIRAEVVKWAKVTPSRE